MQCGVERAGGRRCRVYINRRWRRKACHSSGDMVSLCQPAAAVWGGRGRERGKRVRRERWERGEEREEGRGGGEKVGWRQEGTGQG